MAFDTNPHINLTWVESAISVDDFLQYNVYRRRVTDTEWTRIRKITDRGVTSYEDYTVESDVTYEYAVTQVEDVAGDAVESAKQASPPQASVTIYSIFVHNVANPGEYVQLRSGKQAVSHERPVVYHTPYNAQRPTAFVRKEAARTMSVEYMGRWSTDSEVWETLADLQTSQWEKGALLLARQQRVHMFGQLDGGISRTDEPIFLNVSFALREVRYDEEV